MKTKAYSFYLVAIWLLLFTGLPCLFIIFCSFLSKGQDRLVQLPFTFAAYQALFDPDLLKVGLRSFFMALSTTLLCLALAYPFSYLLIKAKARAFLLLLILIPFWTSAIIRTYSLIALLKTKGLLNTFLMNVHLIDAPLPLLYSNFAVILGLVYNLFPFMVIPIFSNMERFDFRLIEAGKDLGATSLALFFRVLLPNTLEGVIAGCLLVMLPAMTLFYIPNVLGGARSQLLGNLIQDQFLVFDNWPQGAALSVLLGLALLFLLLIYRKTARKLL